METTYTWAAFPAGGTRMTLPQPRQPGRLSKPLAPMMARAMRRANQKDLAQLKSILERR